MLFAVTVQEVVHYRVGVEASSEEEANAIAIKRVVANAARHSSFHGTVEDRDVIEIESVALPKATTEEFASEQRGYEVGMAWDADWRPGGPHVHTCSVNDTPERQARALLSRKVRDAYLQGFEKAIAERGYDFERDASRRLYTQRPKTPA